MDIGSVMQVMHTEKTVLRRIKNYEQHNIYGIYSLEVATLKWFSLL